MSTVFPVTKCCGLIDERRVDYFLFLQVLQNRGLLYLDIHDIENALKDFTEAAKVSHALAVFK